MLRRDACFAPVLQSLGLSAKGGRVLGICNGFQVLTELDFFLVL